MVAALGLPPKGKGAALGVAGRPPAFLETDERRGWLLRSDPDSLDVLDGDVVRGPVVELRGAGALMARDRLCARSSVPAGGKR